MATTARMTALELLRLALGQVGQLEDDGRLTPTQRAHGFRLMRMKLSTWQARGVLLAKVSRTTMSITLAGGATYNLAQSVAGVLVDEVMLRDSNSIDTPLQHWRREQYQRIPDKTTTGSPVAFTVEQNVTNTSGSKTFPGGFSLTFYPAPDATYTIALALESAISDVESDADYIDIPRKYEEALLYDLAYDLAIGSPKSADVMGILAQRRNESWKVLKNDNSERGPVRLRLDLTGF